MGPTYINEQLLSTNLFVNADQVNKNIDYVINYSLPRSLSSKPFILGLV